MDWVPIFPNLHHILLLQNFDIWSKIWRPDLRPCLISNLFCNSSTDHIVYLQQGFLQQSFLQQVFAKVLHKKKYFCNHMLYTYWVSIIVIFARSLCKSSTQIEVFLQPYVVYRDAWYTAYKLSPSCLKIFTITLITRITFMNWLYSLLRSKGCAAFAAIV